MPSFHSILFYFIFNHVIYLPLLLHVLSSLFPIQPIVSKKWKKKIVYLFKNCNGNCKLMPWCVNQVRFVHVKDVARTKNICLMFLSIPPRLLYVAMLLLLQLTQLFLNYQQKYLQSNISKSVIYTTKIAQRLLHSVFLHRRQCYRASNTFPILQAVDTCTPGVPTFSK